MGNNKKFVKARYVLTCDYASISEGGKLSVIGIFDLVGAKNFPMNHAEMFIVAQLKGESGTEHDIKVSIKDPQGVEILPKNRPLIKMKLSGTGLGNIIQRFFNFPFHNPGRYTIFLYEGEEEIGKSELSVIKIDDKKRVVSWLLINTFIC